MIELKKNNWGAAASLVLCVAIFIYDYITPIGSADYIFYFFPVVITIFQDKKYFPMWIAILASIFSWLALQLQPSVNVNAILEMGLNNRIKAGTSIWICAFMAMTILDSRARQVKADWVLIGINRLAQKLIGEYSTHELGQNLLQFLSTYTKVKVSVIYLKSEKSRVLNFLTGVSYSGGKKDIAFGEGVLGQAAIDLKINHIEMVSAGHLKLATGLGESSPQGIFVIPLLANKEFIGVAELALESIPNAETIELFTKMSEMVGIALQAAQLKKSLAATLTETQQMTEELQAQQEELRVVNEELEQQSKSLKDSHSRLENQQAEMEQTNQQLEEQAHSMEHQATLLSATNKDLADKSKELERASQYKSDFLANMSHELRTPLNSSLILAKLLTENKPGNLSKEQIEFAEVIYSSGNDLLNLINDILDLSKVEAGKLNIQPEKIGLRAVKESLEKVFLPVANQKKISFTITIDPKTPEFITSDRMRMEQILKNLLSNAFKFTQKGSVHLNIIRNGTDVEYHVIDTGIGIKLDEQEAIFQAFIQADGTSNRKFGGTGLGLSISRELAKILNGHISIKSEPGKGSTFILHLPENFGISQVQPPRNDLQDLSPAKHEKGLPDIKFSFLDDRESLTGASRKILVIEDDESFAKILVDITREMGFSALASPTADEGLRLAREHRPEAIVLDIRLPDHSGLMVLDQIKMDPKTRHIPVHIISSTDFSKAAREMGAFGYAMKPVTRETLLSVFKGITSFVNQKQKLVLVVEDDQVQKDHIVRLIAGGDVKVDAVGTAGDALEKLAKQTYDCMIMDLSLPDLSGYELLAKLSLDNDRYSFPPVIVYTARDLTRDEEEKLRHYSSSIIIKGAKSHDRLLNEVTLFLHRVETDLPPERQKMLKEFRSREKVLAGRCILVVDDDVRNIFALSSALENCGATILVGRNGLEALDKIEENPEIDLVLMDIMMPEMDGYEAIMRIRTQDKNNKLPIIALTAKTMKDDQAKCLSVGANDYLSKPLDVDKLLSLIRIWLPAKRSFLK